MSVCWGFVFLLFVDGVGGGGSALVLFLVCKSGFFFYFMFLVKMYEKI